MFKKHSRTNLQSFITNYRLLKASELLKNNDNSIEYVALSCGFLSYQSFF
ncbi:helix-turn-helix domain-containing protein [Lactobacillus gasseri]|nr:helix-turn-helix domain-containing protein [Lactobacillus gasseri]